MTTNRPEKAREYKKKRAENKDKKQKQYTSYTLMCSSVTQLIRLGAGLDDTILTACMVYGESAMFLRAILAIYHAIAQCFVNIV